jgi:hypothetical protein
VAEFQNVQFPLLAMGIDLAVVSALLYLAAAKAKEGAPDQTCFAAMARDLAIQWQRHRKECD